MTKEIMAEKFTWIPVYRAIAEKLLEYKDDRKPLIEMIKEMEREGLKSISLNYKPKNKPEIRFNDIDPFTFFANFNRQIKHENRANIIKWLINKWDLTEKAPDDFDGTPTANNQNVRFFRNEIEHQKNDIDSLWLLFEAAMNNRVTDEIYDQSQNIDGLVRKLTLGLYWIKPEEFMTLDKRSITYFKEKYKISNPIYNNSNNLNYKNYLDLMESVKKAIPNKTFYEISYDAWLYPDAPGGGNVSTILSEVFIDDKEFEKIVSLLEHKKNLILQGSPGVGKTFISKRIAYYMMNEKKDENIEMVQFHQSYSYEDFIEGYRPADGNGFEIVEGVFKKFCKKAEENPEEKFFFIIDEINRGNLSKIFGELMMLIEKDKRGKEFEIQLTYSKGEKFYIPENVYLIGTMNTADRSLAIVDYALRRRFAFYNVKPAFGNNKFKAFLQKKGYDDDQINRIVNNLENLNKLISEDNNLGEGFVIGHSYFCPNGEDINHEQWYDLVVEYEIKPLLDEYWFDNPQAVASEISKLKQNV